MTRPIIGKAAPDFTLPSTDGSTVSLSQLQGHPVVIYFYPKDCTPGCTREGCDFRDHFAEFQTLQTTILGISKDTIKLHQKFKADREFPFELLSDTDATVCRLYDVINSKTMFGKLVKGIERSTFLIDANGLLRQEWRKVKVAGHVEAVLSAVKGL